MNILRILDPENIAQEKTLFFKDDTHNPNLHYDWEDEPIYSDNNDLKSKLINAIISQSIPQIIQNAQEYFQTDIEEFKVDAEKILANKPTFNKSPTSKDLVNEFNKAFEFFGLKDFSVELLDLSGFNIRPLPAKKKVLLSKFANYQFFSIEGEIKHEMVHILRYENGKFNNIKRSKEYLPTEEGLATFMQDKSKVNNASQFQHAAEYIASSIGIKGSLRDVYDYFIQLGFDKELAWQRAIRHKFGFIDTSLPGDIIKPAMYFANSQKISKMATEEILKLFVGKISKEEARSIDMYRGIFPKEKIIEFFGI